MNLKMGGQCRSGFLQDPFVDSEGSNNSHIRAFAQDALHDRIIRPLLQPEFQNGIDNLAAGRNGRIYGEASIDDRINAKGGVRKTRGEIREEPIPHSLHGGFRASQKINELHR